MKKIVLAALLALAGCTQTVVWNRPAGISEATYRRDAYACQRDMATATYQPGLSGDLAREDLGEQCMEAKGYTKAE